MLRAMESSELIKSAAKLAARHTVTDGEKFRIAKCDPGDTGPFANGERAGLKASTAELLAGGVRAMSEMQDMRRQFETQQLQLSGVRERIAHIRGGHGKEWARDEAPNLD